MGSVNQPAVLDLYRLKGRMPKCEYLPDGNFTGIRQSHEHFVEFRIFPGMPTFPRVSAEVQA